VHLVGFIIGIYHNAQSSECQSWTDVEVVVPCFNLEELTVTKWDLNVAMADVVGLWLCIAEALVWSQTSPFVMCGGQSGIGTGFRPRVLRHSRVSIIPPMLHTYPPTLCKYWRRHPFCGRWYCVMLIDSIIKLKPRNFWNIKQKCWGHGRKVDKDRMSLDSLRVTDYAPKDSCC
jgi:hypothetical protein